MKARSLLKKAQQISKFPIARQHHPFRELGVQLRWPEGIKGQLRRQGISHSCRSHHEKFLLGPSRKFRFDGGMAEHEQELWMSQKGRERLKSAA